MSAGKMISALLSATVIAGATVFFVVPKLEQRETAMAAEAEAAPAPVPKRDSVSFANAAVISREADGHYWTSADVDGTSVKFMVDTGASIVALTYRDAQRVGLSPEEMVFDNEIRTAGGITMGAFVVLERIRIGQVEVEQVGAMVLQEGLDQSLLGMTFLNELYSYEFKRSQLIIRQ